MLPENKQADDFTIKNLSILSGVPAETIRFYEKSGLIAPAVRAANGYRHFNRRHLAQLRFIKTCRSLGFDLAEIKTLLALRAQPAQDCSNANALARRHLAQVDQKIAELQNIRALLAEMTQCTQSDVAHCRVMATLQAGS